MYGCYTENATRPGIAKSDKNNSTAKTTNQPSHNQEANEQHYKLISFLRVCAALEYGLVSLGLHCF